MIFRLIFERIKDSFESKWPLKTSLGFTSSAAHPRQNQIQVPPPPPCFTPLDCWERLEMAHLSYLQNKVLTWRLSEIFIDPGIDNWCDFQTKFWATSMKIAKEQMPQYTLQFIQTATHIQFKW